MLALAAPSPAAERPSFDCRRATKWVERTLCDDERLSTFAREMSAAYASRRATGR